MEKFILRLFYTASIQLISYSILFADVGVFQTTVQGAVTDAAGNPIPGVTVLVKETSTETITNSTGRYTVSAPEESTLSFSYLGFISQEIPVGGRPTIDVVLQENLTSLNEVVVIGYGTQKAKDVTGSVSSINAAAIDNVPTTNFEMALKGRASGVQVTQNSGAPGGRSQVRIRGGNSMIGDNNPLYVVDGFPITGGIDHINPNDIESIDILKDASATAIYGARGANGVIMVTTKSGKVGQKGAISFHSFYGLQQETRRVNMLNAEQYAIVVNEFLKNEGQDPFFEIDRTAGTVTDGLGNVSTLEGTDWQDVALRRDAPIQQHSLGISGGGADTRYSLSFNYMDQQGIVRNSDSKRGNFRLNLNHEVNNRVSLSAVLNLVRNGVNQVNVQNRGLNDALGMAPPPTLPVYREDGLPTHVQTVYHFGSDNMRNPLENARPRRDLTVRDIVTGNASVSFKISDQLVFKSMFGLESLKSKREFFSPAIWDFDRANASETDISSNSFLNENTLSYNVTLNNVHRFDVVGGLTYQTFQDRSFSVNVEDLPSNITANYNLGSAATIFPPSTAISEWALLSGLARVNYAYGDRYMLTVGMRADGSSRFGSANRWGMFPSAAIGWRVSNEPFMADLTFVDDLKLRGSYGVTGNTALNPYQSLSRLSSNRHIHGNHQEVIGYSPANIPNPHLKWELTRQIDAGFDLSIFQDNLNFSFDYYKKVTSDLLASVPLPISSGFTSVLRNVGKIQNQGIELSINASVVKNDFQWNITGNYSTNKNIVLEIAGGADILSSGIDNPFGSESTNIAREGQEFAAFFGYIEQGVSAENGQRVIKDTNGDGIINALDRVILGSPHPDFIVGLNNEFSYKNFSLNVFVDGAFGHQIFWAEAGPYTNSFQRGHNQIADFFGNYWTAENPDPNSKYPKVSSETTVLVSDKLLFDGSYLRVNMVTLAYNLPVRTISWLNRAQVYISGNNLFTFTNYPGKDPDVNTFGTDSQNARDRLRMGVNGTSYPTAKSIFMGIKLDL